MANAKPFIIRSEVTKTSAEDLARRKTVLSELTEADLDRVSGGTNYDIKPDWNPQTGGDHDTMIDP